ncbi:hypothetical protein BpHYR1_009402 [Brachionus plicatilis]|uniref:Uncharacterized protein n=1 Tax=Brachionus plicatilis TaxID=10195 RepID=A0A3M7RMI4_BRAPC|nr:hypothetical protein BpHYR1_009402 [Brachionus plicatilis]
MDGTYTFQNFLYLKIKFDPNFHLKGFSKIFNFTLASQRVTQTAFEPLLIFKLIKPADPWSFHRSANIFALCICLDHTFRWPKSAEISLIKCPWILLNVIFQPEKDKHISNKIKLSILRDDENVVPKVPTAPIKCINSKTSFQNNI